MFSVYVIVMGVAMNVLWGFSDVRHVVLISLRRAPEKPYGLISLLLGGVFWVRWYAANNCTIKDTGAKTFTKTLDE